MSKAFRKFLKKHFLMSLSSGSFSRSRIHHPELRAQVSYAGKKDAKLLKVACRMTCNKMVNTSVNRREI